MVIFLPNLNIAKRPIPFSPCRIRPFWVLGLLAFLFSLSGVDGLQLIIALALMILAISVAVHCGRELAGAKDNSKAELNN